MEQDIREHLDTHSDTDLTELRELKTDTTLTSLLKAVFKSNPKVSFPTDMDLCPVEHIRELKQLRLDAKLNALQVKADQGIAATKIASLTAERNLFLSQRDNLEANRVNHQQQLAAFQNRHATLEQNYYHVVEECMKIKQQLVAFKQEHDDQLAALQDCRDYYINENAQLRGQLEDMKRRLERRK
jgi:hypothetical protein